MSTSVSVVTRAGSLADCRALVVDVRDAAGDAVVRRLAAEGARVAFSGADDTRSERLVQRVNGLGRDVGHLSRSLAPGDLLEAAAGLLGGLDLVVVLDSPTEEDGGDRPRAPVLEAMERLGVDLVGPTGLTLIAARVDEGARTAGGAGVRLLSLADLELDGISYAEGRAAAVAMVAAGWVPPSWEEREGRSA